MLGFMSETVRLQIIAPERVRRRLKSVAADQGVDMSDLGVILLDYGLSLFAAGKIPPAVVKGLEGLRAGDTEGDGE
jgi:hypothetical protein